MKTRISLATAATLLLAATQLTAQTSGVSHPEDLSDNITVAKPAKPSPAIPMPQTQAAVLEIPTYKVAPVETARITSHETPFDPDDINSGIVTEVPSAANELPPGTLLNVKLDADIATDTTLRGAAFHASLVQGIERHGRVVVPAGSILSGRVAALHSGRRISGPASIQLVPEFLTLPGGITYKLSASVIDLTNRKDSHVSSEGAIVGSDHLKGAAASIGLVAGSGAVAGAVVGAGVGAVVGAGVGAGIGTAVWLRHENQETLSQGTEIIFSLNRPMLLENVAR